ncbi:MAG: peptidylprolyl isomerase [Ginsengibacter sp.]
MSIIQTIRDKGAAIVIGVIALSLIGFLLMDANSGAGKGLFGGNTTTIGSINGNDIEIDEFNNKVKIAEQQYQNPDRQQVMQNVWDQITAERIVTEQFDKLGITFTPPELTSIILSEDAPQQLKQAFSDPQTGQYDIEKARQWLKDTKKSKNQEQREAVSSQVIEPLRLNSLYTKYTAVIAASIYIPAWLTAKESEEGNQFASISYVAIPYTDISDSAVKVTDNEIESYINKNKLKYKQEAGRIISYVSFNSLPDVKDSILTKATVLALKNNFISDTNPKAFISRNISAINYFDGYVLKSKMQMPVKDSIAALSKGSVFGPYIDGNNYVLAKMIDVKQVPDSVKVRHILVKIADNKKGEIKPDSTARKLIDSIALAIKNGADFNEMVLKYSDDEGSKNTKGEYKFSSGSQLVDSFYQTAFYHPVGTKKIVKGESQDYTGYHYIEVLEQSKFEPAYKVGYMAKEIVPSEETINAANIAATKLAGMARDEKSFDKYIKENGLNKISLPNVVKENDYMVGGLQDAREIVKWAFKAKEGEVSEQPFDLKNQFVVAVVSKKVSEGTPDVKTARSMVEAIIRNKKKAGEIIKKLNNPTTLESVAGIYKKSVLNTGSDSTLTFNALFINGIGNEPKVAGACFNKEYQKRISPPIEGNTGVFIIKVNSINSNPDPVVSANQIKSAKMKELIQGNQQAPGALGSSFNALKKMADVKDKRSKFF